MERVAEEGLGRFAARDLRGRLDARRGGRGAGTRVFRAAGDAQLELANSLRQGRATGTTVRVRRAQGLVSRKAEVRREGRSLAREAAPEGAERFGLRMWSSP